MGGTAIAGFSISSNVGVPFFSKRRSDNKIGDCAFLKQPCIEENSGSEIRTFRKCVGVFNFSNVGAPLFSEMEPTANVDLFVFSSVGLPIVFEKVSSVRHRIGGTPFAATGHLVHTCA